MKTRWTSLIAISLLLLSASAAADETPSRLMQVALLVASTDNGTSIEGLSANAKKAIDDIREFLPFSSYKLLDVALVRSNGDSKGLVSGPEGQDYEFEMSFYAQDDTLVFRHFKVSEGGSPAPTVGIGQNQDTSETYRVFAPEAPRTLIQSTFSVNVGETIVVGSSKLDGGGKALLVLLTAIP